MQTLCTLLELGMESLVAIEMRGWWRTSFGSDITEPPSTPLSFVPSEIQPRQVYYYYS